MKNLFKVLTLICVMFFVFNCGGSQKSSEIQKIDEKTEDLPQVKSAWQVLTTVDQFGDKTDQKAIVGLFDGKMSNSAVTNENLKVQVQIQNSNTYVTFYEYGNQIAQLQNGHFLNIDLKLESGDIIMVEQLLLDNLMADTKGIVLSHLLAQTAPLKVVVDFRRLEREENTVYNFNIDPTGLKELIETNQ